MGDEDDDVRAAEGPRPRRRQRVGSPSFEYPAAQAPNPVRERNVYRFGTPTAHDQLVEALPARPPARSFDWNQYIMKPHVPQSAGQLLYTDKLSDKGIQIVICTGPAGCGKTLLAVQEALFELRDNVVGKIVISRPAVTAGESLGFLPGSEADKLKPGAAPVLDAIDKIMGRPGAWTDLQNHHLLELQSFAYMRGRTHERCFVISDETQNATQGQLDMLVTRIGEVPSKLCILGDGEQSDRGTTALVDFARAIESGLLRRAGDDAAKIADSVVVQRLTVADCKRSAAATGMAQLIRFRNHGPDAIAV